FSKINFFVFRRKLIFSGDLYNISWCPSFRQELFFENFLIRHFLNRIIKVPFEGASYNLSQKQVARQHNSPNYFQASFNKRPKASLHG
ncbi:hypothetical protein, partial [Paenibacillus lautus]|uniref:hypothetical protein n=1 Tax=Paenibacillus lautus TaxID=1401 RepID=UPI003D27570D